MQIILGPLVIGWQREKSVEEVIREGVLILKELHEALSWSPSFVGGMDKWEKLAHTALNLEGTLREYKADLTPVIPWSIIRRRRLGHI